MRRLVVLLAFACAPVAGAVEPYVVLHDWVEGHSLAGTTRVLASPVADRFPFEANACHRAILLDLLYEPNETRVSVPGVGRVGFAHDFIVELWSQDARLSQRIVTSPSYGIPLGTLPTAGPHEVTLSLANGADVTWQTRVRGQKVLGEFACLPKVVVNEVEADPAGPDAGHEWVELLNTGDEAADVGLWIVRGTHGDPADLVLPAGTWLDPGARLVVTFAGGQALDNVDEVVELRDAFGVLRDATPTLRDTANDARTWQRSPEGSDAWIFATGTPGAPPEANG